MAPNREINNSNRRTFWISFMDTNECAITIYNFVQHLFVCQPISVSCILKIANIAGIVILRFKWICVDFSVPATISALPIKLLPVLPRLKWIPLAMCHVKFNILIACVRNCFCSLYCAQFRFNCRARKLIEPMFFALFTSTALGSIAKFCSWKPNELLSYVVKR